MCITQIFNYHDVFPEASHFFSFFFKLQQVTNHEIHPIKVELIEIYNTT